MIYKELDDCSEIYFVMSGKYDVGYEINKIRRYRIQFGDRTVIGGFNMANGQRMTFHFMAHVETIAYGIRLKHWRKFEKEYGFYANSLNFHFV